jgi:hypothetical protein
METTTDAPLKWLLDRLIPPFPIDQNSGPAFFAYENHKSATIGGLHVCPLIDPLIRDENVAPYTYVIIGKVPGPEAIKSTHIERKLVWTEFIASLFVFRKSDFNDFRFLQRLYDSKDLCLVKTSDQRHGSRLYRHFYAIRAFLLARYFSLKFRRIAATSSSAHVVVYYNAIMLGVVRAFRELQKPVWDVQHGYLGPHHDAYNNTKAFSLETNLKPTAFLVWDDCFGQHVEETLHMPWRSTNYHHLRSTSPAVQPPTKHKCYVALYSLQWATPVPEEVRLAILHFGNRIEWVFRTHPLEPALRTDIEWLRNFPNVTIAGSNEPLLVALRHCNIHITYNSGVTHEAAALGIHTCFLDPDFSCRVDREIASGLAHLSSGNNLIGTMSDLYSHYSANQA